MLSSLIYLPGQTHWRRSIIGRLLRKWWCCVVLAKNIWSSHLGEDGEETKREVVGVNLVCSCISVYA